MIKGRTVTVRYPTMWENDRYNNAVPVAYDETIVPNVLIAPGATEELEASRPEGVRVAYTLHFPKSFSESLKDCKIVLPAPYGGVYRVIGEPSPYMDENTPTPWHMPVEVVRADG